MGIKDNFSQAVKELWKKDGQDKKGEGSAQPSELDKYLRDGDKGNAAQSGVETSNNGVPLETPYYRTPEQMAAQQTAQNARQEQAAQGVQNVTREQQGGVQAQPNSDRQNQPGGFGAPQNGAEQSAYNRNVQNIRQNFGQNAQNEAQDGYEQNAGAYNQNAGAYNQNAGGYNQNAGGGYGGYNGGNPPAGGGFGGSGTTGGAPVPNQNDATDEITVISKNTIIDGNVNSLANMQIDGNIKGNVQTTRNIDMSGKVIGDVTCNNAGMMSAAMQGNISLKGRMRMDRDTILIGDLSAQYADINGRVRGKLDITGKAELKRDAVVFGDINASTIAVIDGAIIQGYVNTTFLSKEDSRNVFPEAISIDSKEVKS